MRGAFTIAWRDFRSSFDGPLAYALTAAYLAASGAIFVMYLLAFSDLSSDLREAATAAADSGPSNVLAMANIDAMVVTPSVKMFVLLLHVLVPLLTMRLFAQEKAQGTFELLATAPVSPASLVLGKFLGGLMLVLVPITLTLWYPLLLLLIATPDPGILFSAYLGLVLVTAAFTAVGVLASSLTDSALLAAFLAFIGLFVSFLCGAMADGIPTNMGTLLVALSIQRHAGPLVTGLLDTGDIAWLLLFTAAMLFVTHRVVESRRWR